MTRVSVPSSASTIPLYDNRNLKDYDLLNFIVVDDGIARNTVVIPTKIFRSELRRVEIDFSTPSTIRWCEFVYASDTAIQIYGTNTNSTLACVYAYKLNNDSI